MRSLSCGATGIAAEQRQIVALIQVSQHIWTSRQFGGGEGGGVEFEKKKTLLNYINTQSRIVFLFYTK